MREPCKPDRVSIDVVEIGPCYIRSLTMRERGALSKKLEAADSVYDPILVMLSDMIVEEDGEQVWDVDSWDTWCGKHDKEAAELFQAVERAAGYGTADAKKN